ncbi:MAG: outer membrane lipoprotein-sorting protein, partial [Bryobacteraceae bacterium]
PCCLTAATLPEVLAKMDSAAPKFSGMSADVEKLEFTKVIADKSVESGTILIRRAKPKELHVKIEFTKPEQRFVTLRGTKAELYLPKIETVQEIDLGKQSDIVSKVVLVGFGITGKDLQSNYDVKLLGEETVSGQKTYHLSLIPKASQLKAQFNRLEVWLAEDGTLPVQQKVLLPSGDYKTFTYSNIKYNPALSEDALALKLPKNVKREYPQRDRN